MSANVQYVPNEYTKSKESCIPFSIAVKPFGEIDDYVPEVSFGQ